MESTDNNSFRMVTRSQANVSTDNNSFQMVTRSKANVIKRRKICIHCDYCVDNKDYLPSIRGQQHRRKRKISKHKSNNTMNTSFNQVMDGIYSVPDDKENEIEREQQQQELTNTICNLLPNNGQLNMQRELMDLTDDEVVMPRPSNVTSGSLSTIQYLDNLNPYILELFPIYTEKLFNDMKRKLQYKDLDEMVNPVFPFLKVRDMLTVFNKSTWLNDQIINTYLQLISKESNEKIYCLDTFFFVRLMACRKYPGRKLPRLLNINKYSKLLIPVNSNGNHWILFEVDLEVKQVISYDSLNKSNNHIAELIIDFLKSEYSEYGNQWDFLQADSPVQLNQFDCGVFVCLTADHICNKLPPLYTQDHTAIYRECIAYHLMYAEKKSDS